MIKEIPLEKSEIYKIFYEDSKWPIKADSLLMMDDAEVYYSKQDEIIYINDIHLQNNEECYKLLTKDSLNTLMSYLKWDNYAMGVYYYNFDEGMLSIKKI